MAKEKNSIHQHGYMRELAGQTSSVHLPRLFGDCKC